jgi:uncharacterized protein YbjT (DUF2867 family)
MIERVPDRRWRGWRPARGVALLALLMALAGSGGPPAAAAPERSLAPISREDPRPLLTNSDDPLALPRQNGGAVVALTSRQKQKKQLSRQGAAAEIVRPSVAVGVAPRIDADWLPEPPLYTGPGSPGWYSRAPPRTEA